MSLPAFPEKLVELTFVVEFRDKKNRRMGHYRCSCGADVVREVHNARAARLRSSFSSCGKCRRSKVKNRCGIRFGGEL